MIAPLFIFSSKIVHETMRQPCPIRYQLLACPRRALFSAAKVGLRGLEEHFRCLPGCRGAVSVRPNRNFGQNFRKSQ